MNQNFDTPPCLLYVPQYVVGNGLAVNVDQFFALFFQRLPQMLRYPQ